MESIIPDEIQEEILIRLPLKSLLACIFMCKKWKTMICAEDFKTRYLQRSLLMLSMTRCIDLAPDSLFHSLCGRYEVSAPIRGWICIKSSSKLKLYNPITNEIFRLRRWKGGGQLYPGTCLFGYDEANGVFKVLGFFSSSYKVYTVRPRGKGSWRTIACEHHHMYQTPSRYSNNLHTDPPLSVTNALCKGGVLYYAAKTHPDFTPRIMSFDLNTEEFDVIPSPEGFIVDNGSTMVNYNGKVALVNDSATELRNTGGFHICVRKEGSGQWELERVEIPGWRTTVWSLFLFSFVGTIGSAGLLVFSAVVSVFREAEYVVYYNPGTGISGGFWLEGANKGAHHYVRACLNHFECLIHTT